MKIHILYSFHKGPYGGGNQFLKALNKYFKALNIYEENVEKADVILFNSHHETERVIRLKLKYQDKIFIHRIDGPLSFIRSSNPKLDFEIYQLNNLIADGTIFQSNWSKKNNYLLGLKKNKFETVISNASDKNIFYPQKKKSTKKIENKKVNLIATSWSSNFNKGFDLYRFLDENLDFNKYTMIFIGNSPIQFKNIIHIKPLNSYKLAEHLRNSDIFITGSKKDPCSNSLIESLYCGLPSIALNDGGHPEIIKNAGELFNNFEECLNKIQLVSENYEFYKNRISISTMEETALLYSKFMENVLNKVQNRNKHLKLIDYYRFLLKTRRSKSNLLNIFKKRNASNNGII